MWPSALDFFKKAAAAPSSVIDASLSMQLAAAGDAAGDAAAAPTAKRLKRSERARIDMERIRGKAAGDALVERLLAAAFNAMADATENHASEWLPGGETLSVD